MVLSYLVSTAGHAQRQNELYPHGIRTIVQLINEGAREFGDEKVVGFAAPSSPEEGFWKCDRYCKPSNLYGALLTTYSFQATRRLVKQDSSSVGEARARSQSRTNKDSVDTIPHWPRLLGDLDYVDEDGVWGRVDSVS